MQYDFDAWLSVFPAQDPPVACDTNFVLVDNDGKLLVPAVDGWILRADQLYGSHGERGYFAIALPNTDVRLFDDMRHLNHYLFDLGFPSYNMSDEESAVDNKYSRGRQRQYAPGN